MEGLRGRWDFALALGLFAFALLAQRGDWFAALELQTQSYRQLVRMGNEDRSSPRSRSFLSIRTRPSLRITAAGPYGA